MELFETIRREYVAGETINGLAQKHGVHRRMIRQALADAVPPGTPNRSPSRVALTYSKYKVCTRASKFSPDTSA
jgi:hypothetical protein